MLEVCSWGEASFLMVQKTSDLQVKNTQENYPAMRKWHKFWFRWKMEHVWHRRCENRSISLDLHTVWAGLLQARLAPPRGTERNRGGRTSGAARRSGSGSTRRTLEENTASAPSTRDTLVLILHLDFNSPGSSWLLLPIRPTNELTFCPFKIRVEEIIEGDWMTSSKPFKRHSK